MHGSDLWWSLTFENLEPPTKKHIKGSETP
jgi:hypothetical protein